MKQTGIFGIALAAATMLAITSSNAFAYGETNLSHLHDGRKSLPPIGWVQFCRDNASECEAEPLEPARITLDEANWRTIVRVNREANKAIAPVTDADQFGVPENWTYAVTGSGDCEDYVLEKRRALLELGFPRQALLITVVLDKEGSGHAVLTVMTDRGEFILDNQTGDILPWSQSGLTFLKRQSAEDPNTWLSLGRVLGVPEVVTGAR